MQRGETVRVSQPEHGPCIARRPHAADTTHTHHASAPNHSTTLRISGKGGAKRQTAGRKDGRRRLAGRKSKSRAATTPSLASDAAAAPGPQPAASHPKSAPREDNDATPYMQRSGSAGWAPLRSRARACRHPRRSWAQQKPAVVKPPRGSPRSDGGGQHPAHVPGGRGGNDRPYQTLPEVHWPAVGCGSRSRPGATAA